MRPWGEVACLRSGESCQCKEQSGIAACLVNCGLKRVSRALGHPMGCILSLFSLVKLSRLKLLSCFSSTEFQTFHKLKQPLSNYTSLFSSPALVSSSPNPTV